MGKSVLEEFNLTYDELNKMIKSGRRPFKCDKCGYKAIVDTEEFFNCINNKINPCPWCNREEEKYKPKCPTCQSPDIKKISTASKAVSVGLFGIFSSKVRKTFHCNGCGYEW